MSEPSRILHFAPGFRFGGVETFLLEFLRVHHRIGLAYDLVVDTVDWLPQFEEVEGLGGRIWRLGRYLGAPVSYQRKFQAILEDHASEYLAFHVHDPVRSIPLLPYARRHGIKRCILHAHTDSYQGSWRAYVNPLLQPVANLFATDMLACSKSAGRYSYGRREFTVIRNAINLARFRHSPERRAETRALYGIGEDAQVIGHTGRFTFQKNHALALRVFAAVVEEDPDARLMLVGSGPLQAPIEKLASQLGIAGNVLFAGQHDDVVPFLDAMDLFLLPSHFEGLGISLIEAQANGLPCVVSDRIPHEAVVTQNVYRMRLKDLPRDWARQVRSISGRQAGGTEHNISLLRESGFDVQEEAENLLQIYVR